MKKTVVTGHICIDITPVFGNTEGAGIADILKPGKLINVGPAEISTGGTVANTGIALIKMGSPAILVGKIGNDAFGEIIRKKFEEYGASDTLITDEKHPTSYTAVIAIPGTDRVFLHCPGVNNYFTSDDVTHEMLCEADMLHFGYPPLMKKMYENDAEQLYKLFKKTTEAGCVTSMDMTSIDPSSEAGKQDWRKILERVLPYTDLFEPSIEELCFMLDRKRYYSWQERAKGRDVTEVIDVKENARELGQMCIEMGSSTVVVKCGRPGMYLCSAEKNRVSRVFEKLEIETSEDWNNLDIFGRSFVPDRIASATGCGDTAIAAFLTSIKRGKKPSECLDLALGTGAVCITSFDATGAIVRLEEIEKKIKQGWKRI